MKRDSFESSVKSTEIARLIGSKSMATSSYTVIDDVLIRISNHYPVYYNLNEYNNLDDLKGIIFVFVGENTEKYCYQIENDKDYSNMYVECLSIDLEDNDYDYLINNINKKIKNFQ